VQCHTPFIPLPSTTFLLGNPATTSQVVIPVAHHSADALDVSEGYALFAGQPGLRLYGDFRMHKMGALMRSIGLNGPDTFKTAELWDVGSVSPLLRDGSAGMDVRQAIVRHEGVSRSDVSIVRDPQTQISPTQRQQVITLTNTGNEVIDASVDAPIRVVIVGQMLPASASAANADGLAPDGQRREGAFWSIVDPLAPGASVSLTLVFLATSEVTYELVVQDHNGFSEAVASARAFLRLRSSDQQAVVDFLRVQTINGQFGEGSGGLLGRPDKTVLLQIGGDQRANTGLIIR
jgi:hypothetical protein